MKQCDTTLVSNRSLKHKGMGSESGVTRLKSQGMSLEVMCYKFTEEGNNICICLSFPMEGLSWRLLQCKGGHQAAHRGLQLGIGPMALLVTFPL